MIDPLLTSLFLLVLEARWLPSSSEGSRIYHSIHK
jgi:hypothetical protein